MSKRFCLVLVMTGAAAIVLQACSDRTITPPATVEDSPAVSECEPGQLCDPPVDPVAGCDQSCTDLGFECGEHCGVSCGSCAGAQQACVQGRCECMPACALSPCETADGCGGTCGPCATYESCTDCPLKLSVMEVEDYGGVLRTVTLRVDFSPAEGDALPGIADIRMNVSGPVELKSVGVSPVILDAEKELFVDPNTGKPFRELADGTTQILIFSSANTTKIPGGHWLYLKFKFAKDAAQSAEPAVFQLVEREQIFAPPDADSALWKAPLDGQVVVWSQVADDE